MPGSSSRCCRSSSDFSAVSGCTEEFEWSFKEADKIKGWRKDAIKDLVGDEHTVPSMEDLHQAALDRDEYFANNAYKAMMLKNEAIVLAVILVSILAICLWRFKVQEEGPPMAITVGLFGILGGTVRAITSVPRFCAPVSGVDPHP